MPATDRTRTQTQTQRPDRAGPQRRPANRGAGRARDSTAPGSRAPRRPTPHGLFAERLLAVLGGLRPVHQMIGQVTGGAYEELLALTSGSASPFAPSAAPGSRPVLRSCRGVPLRPGVVEASANLETGGRVHAMAFRLERGQDQRWRCTALELAGSRTGPSLIG